MQMRKTRNYPTYQTFFFFLNNIFLWVRLKHRPQTAQVLYWCGAEQPCPPEHSDLLPLLVLLHKKKKKNQNIGQYLKKRGFGSMIGLIKIN